MRFVVIVACLLVLSAGCAGMNPSMQTPANEEESTETVQSPSQPTTPSADRFEVDTDRIEDLIHEKMNERREENGVDALARNESLDRVGRYKSWDMAQRDYFGHIGPNGTTHHGLRERFGTGCEYIGQNLLYDMVGSDVYNPHLELQKYGEISEVAVNSLLNSTGHRQNALSSDYDSQGIGVFVDENGTVYVTQELCG